MSQKGEIVVQYPYEESSTLEWKKEMPKNDQIIKTIIGFCNQNGGRVVIGVANTGKIEGLSDREIQKELEFLEKTVYESSHPPILPKVYTQRFGDRSVLNIEVSSGMSKPYFRKSEGINKGTYIRLGRSTLRATPDMIEELKWQSLGLAFETLPNYRAKEGDLDSKKIHDFFKNRRKKSKIEFDQSILKAYHIIKEEHSKFYPTHMGLLLFGKDPQYFHSEAMIICSHFKGNSGRDAIASVDYEGTLFNQFEQSYAFIIDRLYKSFKIRKMKRKEKLEIPEIAVREALLNAIIHRNYHISAPTKVAIYDDRIEIFSPGPFPGPLNQKNLKLGITYLRNPAIYKLFREADYIEKLGTGIISIFDSYEKYGLEEPKILEGENFVKTILPRILQKKTSKKEVNFMKELFVISSEISIEDICKILGVSRQTTSRKMNQLIKQGLVERVGKTRSTRYRKK